VKLAFFGYAWNRQHQPDAYMLETINALVAAGADVDLYLGSKLSKEYGIYGLNEAVKLDRLVAFMAGQAYEGAIAFNNSMLIPQVREAIKGRIATVIVDEPEHLFDYMRAGVWEVFRHDIEIVAMSSALERRLLAAVEGVAPRIHFMLPATHIDPAERAAAPIYPISWVASYVGDLNLDNYLKLITERPEFYALTRRCIDIIERDGDLRSVKSEAGEDAALIASLPWSFDYFQTQMQNILTNRGRVAAVERLSPHGLALFGNAAWQKLLTYNAAVLASLQPGPPPASHADLRRVYNASRVSINMPQAHVSPDAVQYRVIDVMASNAVMITQHSKNSDLYRVFGEDCPVPTYSDIDELEALCAQYLADEDARRAVVARCNALVATGYTFAERAAEFLRIVGLEPGPSPGRLREIDINMFTA
jgi:hypothetical protein